MKSIKIEDHLFKDLVKEVVETGKSFTQLIETYRDQSKNGQSSSQKVGIDNQLQGYIESPEYVAKRSKIDRFLGLLSFIHNQNSDQFEKVLNISGRSRKYFALSKRELQESGNKVFPRNIPDTDYWVISNTSTSQKKEMISDVMNILSYRNKIINNVLKSIDK